MEITRYIYGYNENGIDNLLDKFKRNKKQDIKQLLKSLEDNGKYTYIVKGADNDIVDIDEDDKNQNIEIL